MPIISVDVDVDMSELDTDDLIDELTKRARKANQKRQGEAFKSECQDLLDEIEPDAPNLPSGTLEDAMKIEHLAKVWDEYTSADIERLLP